MQRVLAASILVCFTCTSGMARAACSVDADCHRGEVCERNVCTTPSLPGFEPEPQYAPEPPRYPPEPPRYAVPMRPRWHHYSPGMRTTGIVLFSVGLPLAITGAVLWPMYRASYLTYGDPNDYNAELTGMTLALSGTAAAITGIVLWSIGGRRIYDGYGENKPPLHPILQFSRGGGGVVGLAGHF